MKKVKVELEVDEILAEMIEKGEVKQFGFGEHWIPFKPLTDENEIVSGLTCPECGGEIIVVCKGCGEKYESSLLWKRV